MDDVHPDASSHDPGIALYCPLPTLSHGTELRVCAWGQNAIQVSCFMMFEREYAIKN